MIKETVSAAWACADKLGQDKADCSGCNSAYQFE